MRHPKPPESTPYLDFSASSATIENELSALAPVKAAGIKVNVDRTGPFVGGGYSWSIAFLPSDPPNWNNKGDGDLTVPKVGVQQANITGTGAHVLVTHRDTHEVVAAEQVLSLAAPLLPVTVEEQVVACNLMGLTPPEAAKAGASFVLEFRGERTEVIHIQNSAYKSRSGVF